MSLYLKDVAALTPSLLCTKILEREISYLFAKIQQAHSCALCPYILRSFVVLVSVNERLQPWITIPIHHH